MAKKRIKSSYRTVPGYDENKPLKDQNQAVINCYCKDYFPNGAKKGVCKDHRPVNLINSGSSPAISTKDTSSNNLKSFSTINCPCISSSNSRTKIKHIIDSLVVEFKLELNTNIQIKLSQPKSPELVFITFSELNPISDELFQNFKKIFKNQETFKSENKIMIALKFEEMTDSNFNDKVFNSIKNQIKDCLVLESISTGQTLLTSIQKNKSDKVA